MGEGKTGPPLGSFNAEKHGVTRHMRTGGLPKGSSYIRRVCNGLIGELQAAVKEQQGDKITIYQIARSQTAARAEARCLLLLRYLRNEPGLTLDQRIKLLADIEGASQSRDRAIRDLGLAPHKDDDVWSLPFIENTAEPHENHAEQGQERVISPQDDPTPMPTPDASEPPTLEVLP